MNTTILRKIIVICLFISATAILPSKIQALEITPESIDLGDISKGTIIKKELVIKNDYKKTITLEKARSSCECVKVEYKKNTLIEGGKDYIVRLIIDTSELPEGKMIKFLFLSFKNSSEPIFSITIKGNITSQVYQHTP